MRQVEPQPGGPIGPQEWRKIIPVEPAATSDPLGREIRRLIREATLMADAIPTPCS